MADGAANVWLWLNGEVQAHRMWNLQLKLVGEGEGVCAHLPGKQGESRGIHLGLTRQVVYRLSLRLGGTVPQSTKTRPQKLQHHKPAA